MKNKELDAEVAKYIAEEFERLVGLYLRDHDLEKKELEITKITVTGYGSGSATGEIKDYDLCFWFTMSNYAGNTYLRAFRDLGHVQIDTVTHHADNKKILSESPITRAYKDSHLSGVPWAKDFPCNEEEE